MTQHTLFNITAFDPTTSIVGNGSAGQVTSNLNANGYSWFLSSTNLPGSVLVGTFPNLENPNSITRQNFAVTWPYRGGQNLPAAVPQPRREGFIGITAVGLLIFSPGINRRVIGNKGSVWNINATESGIIGQDIYGGSVSAGGIYHYDNVKFVTNNAWANISGFTTGYVSAGGHSKIIGWAADGYPIYGPYGYAVSTDSTSPIVKMQSGYSAVNQDNRPKNIVFKTQGSTINSDQIRVQDVTGLGPGMRLQADVLPGEVKILDITKNVLTLDIAISVPNNTQIQAVWPLGIFVEDFVYVSGNNTLDQHNGRYCVTPEFPNGTYAYFATVDQDDLPQFPYFVGSTFYGDLQITAPPSSNNLVWLVQNSDLGSINTNEFFTIQLQISSPTYPVLFKIIAGDIPPGVQVTSSGIVEGVPTDTALIYGVPDLTDLAQSGIDQTYKFVIRAYTEKVVNGVVVVDLFKDKTFTLTIVGRGLPQFVNPEGLLAEFYDGGPIDPIQLEFTDTIPQTAFAKVVAGQLPPGLTLSEKGLISGYIIPAALIDQPAGYDLTPEDEYGYDFLTQASNFNYQFTIQISNGSDVNLRTFEIYVISRNTLSADTTVWTADDTIITADETSDRLPFLTNPQGSIGTVQDDTFFAYKFNALDLDQQQVEYILVEQSGPTYNWSIPQGLQLDPITGWLYGLLPLQSLSELTYTIAIRVRDLNDPSIQSELYFYTLTVVSGIDKRVTWLTDANLGSIINGQPSLFSIEATSPQREDLSFRLASGSASLLPQGLELLPNGLIAGTVSYATFAIDNGTTTFDVNTKNPAITQPTTWDLTYNFTVNAYSPTTQETIYKVSAIVIQDQGSFYSSVPTVTIAPPPASGIPATVGSVTVVDGKITNVTIANPGAGYRSAPVITVTGGGAFAVQAILTASIESIATRFLVSENKTFTITVTRKFNNPVNTLYIEALPPITNRQIIDNLVQNINLLPPASIYRFNDSNFGVSKKVLYAHAYGIEPATFEEYVAALRLNHYTKQLTLGEIKTARATDVNGNVVYEVIYSEIVDNLVNEKGESVGKEVNLTFPVSLTDSTEVSTVYPNSLVDMRTQVINTVGSLSVPLPLWMTSVQEDKKSLGFVPAWVIAYVKPGQSKKLAYYINQQFHSQLNKIDFTVDRYILDAHLSKNWDPVADSVNGAWVPTPAMTTFDQELHYRPLQPDGSTESFFGGVGYIVGSKIRIPGSSLNGITGQNDLVITVNTVDSVGTILGFFMTGIAFYAAQNITFYAVSGTTIAGSGTGANFDIVINSPQNTRFDGNSLLFIAPVDNYLGYSQSNDKYLVFPKQNILE